MPVVRALICFAVFLGAAAVAPHMLHDAPAFIGVLFGVVIGAFFALITATLLAVPASPRAAANYWWSPGPQSAMQGEWPT